MLEIQRRFGGCARQWFAVLALIACAGCAAIPGRRASLDHVDFVGNAHVDSDELRDHIASTESPRFLGLFEGVIYDYEIFDRYVLERDLQRVERYYRTRGYYKARVRAGRVYFKGRGARVEILVEEGPLTRVARLDIHGLETLPPEIALRVKRRVLRALPLGGGFEETHYDEASGELKKALNDHGYAYAEVTRAADVDMPRDLASVGFWIKPGILARYGSVRFVGLGVIPEEPVRRALALEPGATYSLKELESAQQALLDLGVFSSVKIEPDLPENASPDQQRPDIPLRVVVEPSKLRSVQFGVGAELDTLRTDLHLTTGWEDRNFLGGLRRFTVQFVPGVVLYPTRLPNLPAPQHVLPEGRLRTEFRQPGVFEARTNGFIKTQLTASPVLLTPEYQAGSPVLGYGDARAGVGLDRTYWKFFGALSQNVQFSVPFMYLGPKDPDLNPIVVSYPELNLTLDLRNDRVHPHHGVYVASDLQVAGVGGDARDVKIQPELRGYVPIAKRVTFATRAAIGLLFPQNYGSTVESDALTGTPGNASRAAWVRDLQLMFLRGFFSGGPGSNRGYALREIGPHGVIPFYNGAQGAGGATNCDPTSPAYSETLCDLPLGGFTLWEASAELRYPITGAFAGTLFSDASDVSDRRVDFRFDRPHLSAGLGFRYDTPVGPLRLDVGYRIPGAQAPKAADEGTPQTLFGAPVAVSLGIGEAF
jgi:outer membrane protein insertion porin family/translocation and assembly module TamA